MHPVSPVRAKLSIHLHAKGVSEAPTPSENIPYEVTDVVEKGVDMLKIQTNPAKIPNGITTQASGTNWTAPEPYIIEDVREFRSQLAASAGPRPVKDLSEFEELDSKL